MRTPACDAVWATSWPFTEYVKHAWAGAWLCSLFRNESAIRADALIADAVAATLAVYGDPPALGMVTFIDRGKVRPTAVRGVRTWGRTYKLAGFREAGETAGGLLVLRLAPEAMPAPALPMRYQLRIQEAA